MKLWSLGVGLAVCIAASPPALAGMFHASARATVKAIAAEYIGAITCQTRSEAAQGIIGEVRLSHQRKTKDDPGSDKWAVVFTAGMSGGSPYMACGGGSGNPPTYLVIVEKPEDALGYYLDPSRSFPNIDFKEPIDVVTSVTSVVPGTITLKGLNYGPHDSQADPSVPATITMEQTKTGHWEVVKLEAVK